MKTLKIYLSIFVSIVFFIAGSSVFSQNTFRCLEFKSATDGIVAGDNGMIMKTTDAGITWYQVNSNTLNNLNKTTVIDGDNMVAAGDYGTIIKSTDAGETWNLMESNTTQRLRGVFINSDGIGFAVGNNGSMINTYDHGQTWSVPERISFVQNLTAVTMSDEGNAVLVGEKNSIALSNDTGATWTAPPTVLSFEMSLNFVRMIDRSTVFATSSFGEIIKSEDRGNTWIVVYSNPEHNAFYRINKIRDNLVCVGDNGKIILSPDMGNTWIDINSGTSSRLLCLNFADDNVGYSGGENGTLLKTIDGGYTWEPVNYTLSKHNAINPQGNAVNSANEFSVSQNYPNPFNPSTKISFTMPFEGFVNVTVLDITGREVTSLMNGYQKQGNYSLTFDGSNLSSGIYFYRINVDNKGLNFTKTMKMLLVK